MCLQQPDKDDYLILLLHKINREICKVFDFNM
jgi:hypothetical protein